MESLHKVGNADMELLQFQGLGLICVGELYIYISITFFMLFTHKFLLFVLVKVIFLLAASTLNSKVDSAGVQSCRDWE